MKRGLIICLVFLLVFTLFINFVVAETNTQTETQETTNQNSPENNLGDFKNIGETLKNKPNEILYKEITLPEKIETPARVIFGLKSDDKLDMQFFIILTCVLIFVLLITRNFVQFIPPFKGGTSWVGALVFTLLFSISGAMRYIANLFLDLGKGINFLEELGALKLGLLVITIIVIYIISSIAIGIIKENIILGKSIRDGIKIGAKLAKQKAIAETEGLVG